MSITINTKTYTQDAASGPNSIPYNGPAATLSVKDKLELGRTIAKGNAVYSGNARERAKLTRTTTLTGAKTTSGDMIFDLGSSIPIGTADAVIDTACDDLAAFIGSATYKTLVKKQLLSY